MKLWRACVLILAVAALAGGLAVGCGGGEEPLGSQDANTQHDQVDAGSGLANGTTCTSDSACQSKYCECIDFECNKRVCAAADCVCGYGTSGSCTDPIPTGSKDPEDCDSPSVNCAGINKCR